VLVQIICNETVNHISNTAAAKHLARTVTYIERPQSTALTGSEVH